ncbi:MAG: TraR/DksA C4-type zinc finger protein [Magnetospirillum sp.]|nr:TraR/DksA C4-type zinc finger protein [Magnetospirillum sp.]
MDDIDCAAERIEAFNAGALKAVLNRMDGPSSSGVCQDCGCVIETDRLKANPRARYCRECADEIEQESRRSRLCGPR